MVQLNDDLHQFLHGRHYATLATINEDRSIHLTPVLYLFDHPCFFVDTAPTDRKVRNILERPEASIVVDRRTQGSERWVSAAGTVTLLQGSDAEAINAQIWQRYLTPAGLRHPQIGPVFAAAAPATLVLKPAAWHSWNIKALDDAYFGGLLFQAPRQWFLPID